MKAGKVTIRQMTFTVGSLKTKQKIGLMLGHHIFHINEKYTTYNDHSFIMAEVN